MPTMNRNSLNLAFVALLLLLVTACFCRSDRDSGGTRDTPRISELTSTDSERGSDPSRRKDEGDFLVEHLDVSTPRYLELDQQIKNERLLESAAEQLNNALVLPHDIFLRTKDCNQVNAFYSPSERSITMCYELMEHFYRIFKSVGNSDEEAYDKMFSAVRFVFLHEIGHALIDVYSLPVAGNEEDAADRLSSYVNLTELGDEGVEAVFAAADAFAIESKLSKPGRANLAGEHLLQEQRFYNSLCMIYGSNVGRYSKIVTEGYLPRERAERCPAEYKRTVDSWILLLEPWRK